MVGVKVSPRSSSGEEVPTVGGVLMSWWEGEISENYLCHYGEMIITLTVFCQVREGLGVLWQQFCLCIAVTCVCGKINTFQIVSVYFYSSCFC